MRCTCAEACGCVYSTTGTWILVLQLGCQSAASVSIFICIYGYYQAWPHAPSCEVVRDYQNHVGDSHLFLTNQITVFVTAMT